MIEYRFAAAHEREALLDFINMVFSMLCVPHNFIEMLPKAYTAENWQENNHIIAVEDGRICGCFGVYTFPMRVGAQVLKVGFLGSMAVHPRMRGRGVMGELMRRQLAHCRELGLDLLALGGQRQRYSRFGFEPCGAAYTYSVTPANIRHAYPDVDAQGMGFAPLNREDVPFALELYSAQCAAGARTAENFLETLGSYRGKPWLITKNGERAGYLSVSGDGQRITELLLTDWAMLPAALKGWIERNGTMNIVAAPHNTALNRALAPVCEEYTISPNCAMLCLNIPKVIRAYMELKHSLSPLRDGRLKIAFGDGGVFEIRVEAGEISVTQTSDAADVSLDVCGMQQLLFGFNRFTVAQPACVPEGWFPLPFYIGEPDSF